MTWTDVFQYLVLIGGVLGLIVLACYLIDKFM